MSPSRNRVFYRKYFLITKKIIIIAKRFYRVFYTYVYTFFNNARRNNNTLNITIFSPTFIIIRTVYWDVFLKKKNRVVQIIKLHFVSFLLYCRRRVFIIVNLSENSVNFRTTCSLLRGILYAYFNNTYSISIKLRGTLGFPFFFFENFRMAEIKKTGHYHISYRISAYEQTNKKMVSL